MTAILRNIYDHALQLGAVAGLLALWCEAAYGLGTVALMIMAPSIVLILLFQGAVLILRDRVRSRLRERERLHADLGVTPALRGRAMRRVL